MDAVGKDGVRDDEELPDLDGDELLDYLLDTTVFSYKNESVTLREIVEHTIEKAVSKVRK